MIDMEHFSKLSCQLLAKIVSYLPIKEAVRTSILSTRWEDVWRYLVRFDLDDSKHSSSEFYIIWRVVKHWQRARDIESFRIKISKWNWYYTLKDLFDMVKYSVFHNISDLEICFALFPSYPLDPDKLPCSLYSIDALVTLKLNGCRILANVLGLDWSKLSSLKTFHLLSVTYCKKNTLEHLLSICPVLEELLVDRCKSERMGELVVRSNSLHRLTINIPWDCECIGFLIDTPGLHFFRFVDHWYKRHPCSVEMMHGLKEAYVDVLLCIG